MTKLNASGSALAYSTFLGGTEIDDGAGIAVRGGRAYVTGGTRSADYPTTPGAFDTDLNGAQRRLRDEAANQLRAALWVSVREEQRGRKVPSMGIYLFSSGYAPQ